METALSEPREVSGEKNHTPSDGPTCNHATGPEFNSLLTKIADTLSTIPQPLPSDPLPLLPPFDPSALLSTLTSQGASLDSLLDSLTRGVHGTSPLLSSTTAPLPPSSSLTSLPDTQSTRGPPVVPSVLLPSTLESLAPSSSSNGAVLPDPILSQETISRPPPPPRGALAINGVPAVTATVVARSVSPTAPPLPPPPAALVASALPPVAAPSSPTSIPRAFTATPLTTSHLPPPPPPPPSTSAPINSGSAVAPPTAIPLANHELSTEPFLSAPLPASSTNRLITQGPPHISDTPDTMMAALTDEMELTQPPPPPPANDVEALVNELTVQELPPEMASVHTQMSSGSSVATETSQETPPASSEAAINNERISQELPPPPSPPSLHANEELLSDDSEEEGEMEGTAPQSGGSLAPPTASANAVAGSRSDSASPYTDDASFASFVAGEAHDLGSPMEDEHFSPSPSPLPSVAQSIDALVSQMHAHPPPHSSSSSSQLAMQAQFGVTAYCPRAPILPPSDAAPAPLDMTTQNFPKRSKYAHRAAMSAMHPYQRTRGGGVNVAKTLDLLKAVLQSSFNMEVKRLCDDYLQLYCQAAANIRENTGDTVPEATLRLLVNKMLEEAQHGYQKGEWEFPSSKLPRNEKVAPAKASPMAYKKQLKSEKGENRYGPPKRARRPPADHHTTGSEKTSWKWSMDKKRVDPGKWKPDTLFPDTYFVLGVNVNKALGHGANRGKVYYLHPELFKYACDGDDKTWLYENKLLPVHGGKAFLMMLKEVNFLAGSEECYRNNKDILSAVRKLQEFQVPQFMLDKMKTFMRSVQGYFAQEASSSSSSSAQTATNSQDVATSSSMAQQNSY